MQSDSTDRGTTPTLHASPSPDLRYSLNWGRKQPQMAAAQCSELNGRRVHTSYCMWTPRFFLPFVRPGRLPTRMRVFMINILHHRSRHSLDGCLLADRRRPYCRATHLSREGVVATRPPFPWLLRRPGPFRIGDGKAPRAGGFGRAKRERERERGRGRSREGK